VVALEKQIPITLSKVPKMIKKGRGKGFGKDYLPWFTVRDVSSNGFSHRIKGWKTKRVHHLLSNLELNFFYLLEWSEKVTDIREKYPLLPVEKTIDISQRLGLRHPFHPQNGEEIILTTDFLVCIKDGNSSKMIAYSVMPEQKSKTRIEKTFIERTYWTDKGIEFVVITNQDIPLQMVRNIEWIHTAKELTFAPNGSIDKLAEIEYFLYRELYQTNISISIGCINVDKYLRLTNGTSLWVFRHLIANRYWKVDIKPKIDASQPIQFIRNTNFIPIEGDLL
jgi:hypothetical protein